MSCELGSRPSEGQTTCSAVLENLTFYKIEAGVKYHLHEILNMDNNQIEEIRGVIVKYIASLGNVAESANARDYEFS